MSKFNYIEAPRISFNLTSLVFIPVLFYPPLLFSNQITASFRISLFVLMTMYLFLATKRFQKKDLLILILFAILFTSTLIINFNSLAGLRTVGNVLLTLVFAYALSRAVKMNNRIKKSLVTTYTFFFTLVPICSLMSLIFFLIFGKLNLYNISSEGYDYLVTPFGVMLHKHFFGIGGYRSFFFFIEPVYLAFFYAANIFLVAPYLKEKSSFFLVANVIGGFLTFSYLFFVFSAILFVAKNTSFSYNNALRLLLLLCLITILIMVGFFSTSSLGDRFYRMSLFLKTMKETNTLQFMFGRGFMAQTGYDKNFSAGLLSTIYESGIINLIVIILFLFVLSNKKKYIFLLFFIPMLVFEPIKLPLFWVLVVVLTVLLPDRSHIRSTSISQCSSLVAKVNS